MVMLGVTIRKIDAKPATRLPNRSSCFAPRGGSPCVGNSTWRSHPGVQLASMKSARADLFVYD